MNDGTLQLLETVIKFAAGVTVILKVIEEAFKRFDKKHNKEILNQLEAVKKDLESLKHENINWKQAVAELKKDFDLLYDKILEKAFR